MLSFAYQFNINYIKSSLYCMWCDVNEIDFLEFIKMLKYKLSERL